jgi:hypothetical protein
MEDILAVSVPPCLCGSSNSSFLPYPSVSISAINHLEPGIWSFHIESPHVASYNEVMARGFLIAFVVGFVFSALYVMFGPWSWFAPRDQLARILFAPGLCAAEWADGYLFRQLHGQLEFLSCVVVGCATMGFIFGFAGALIGLGFGKRHGIAGDDARRL